MRKLLIGVFVCGLAGCSPLTKESYWCERNFSNGEKIDESMDNVTELRIIKLKEYQNGERKTDEIFRFKNANAN